MKDTTKAYINHYMEYVESAASASSEPVPFYYWLTDGVDNELTHEEASAVISDTKDTPEFYPYLMAVNENGRRGEPLNLQYIACEADELRSALKK